MRILAEDELVAIAGAGDFYFTLKISTEGLSDTCTNAFYDLVSAEVNHSANEQTVTNLLFLCSINDILLLGSIAETGEYVRTEFL